MRDRCAARMVPAGFGPGNICAKVGLPRCRPVVTVTDGHFAVWFTHLSLMYVEC